MFSSTTQLLAASSSNPPRAKHTEYRQTFETNFFAIIEPNDHTRTSYSQGQTRIQCHRQRYVWFGIQRCPSGTRSYNGANAYGSSKIALNLYIIALARELEKEQM
ncbi:short-chain dehydrogenase reductase sdr [Moniliophthora roreri]|nr:short-chain dehydrogenase reductase sdr [Moniliophthora roreri]